MDQTHHHAIVVALEERRNGRFAKISAEDADLAGVQLDGADLGKAQLSRAKLTLANLAGANLERAELSGASLHACDLSGADLTEAVLKDADLSKAVFSDAVLVGVDLRGAYLRGMLGEPLSLAGALIDQAAVTRSGLSDAEVTRWLERGARMDNPDSIPPSAQLVESARPPSIVPRLQQHEIAARHQQANEDFASVPTSQRAFNLLNNLIEQATTDEEMPLSLRSKSLPMVKVEELNDSDIPRVGGVYLGYRVEEELSIGSTARTFVGKDEDGTQVFIKTFDPFRPGAALQLPAFQRGLRAMNRAQIRDKKREHVVQLLAVARDMTGYVCLHYSGGSLDDVVDADITLDAGLSLMESLCRSVQFLHEENVLVRSFKPSNLIMDGLNPLLSELDMLDLPTLAQSSPNVGGYAPYVAPEEIARMGTRSPTADIHCLGKLFEYLLTGTAPYKPITGPTPLESKEGVPEFFIGVVKRATAPDPAQRYQYIDELLGDLRRFREEGAAARLRQPLRVRTLSRLQPLPSMAPPLTTAPGSELFGSVPPQEVAPEPKGLLSASRRYGLAALSGFILLAACGTVALAPQRVDTVESLWTGVALLSGFLLWFLPARTGARWVYAGLFLAAAWLVHWVGPLPVAQARWEYDLERGSRPQKERAVTNLSRVGKRSFDGLDLRGLSLVRQDLADTSFRGANLTGSDLSGAFIQGADFQDAQLNDVSIVSADLRNASLQNGQGLGSVRCDQWSLLPGDFSCEAQRLLSASMPTPTAGSSDDEPAPNGEADEPAPSGEAPVEDAATSERP